MTLPYERSRSVQIARDLLLDIATPSETPKVPLHIRDRARAALRHFPTHTDLLEVEQRCPHVFSSVTSPVWHHDPLFPPQKKKSSWWWW